MGFSKAVQNTHSELFSWYIQEKMSYSEECKLFYKAQRLYKNSVEPMEKLRWFEARERYSLASKSYRAAEERYVREKALEELKAKGVDVSTLTLRNIAQIEVPTSMKDIADQVRRDNEQTLILLDPAARKLIEEMKTPEYASMRQQFMDEMDESKDVTLDDSPLTEQQEQQTPIIVDAKEKITEIDEDGFKITFKEKDPTDGDFEF